MSRYHIPTKGGKFNVYVGWDNPMQTFFAQVSDLSVQGEDEEETYPVWLGGTPGECTDVNQVANAIAEYATLSEVLKQQLIKDYAERTDPTSLQKFAVRSFKEALKQE